MYISLLKLNNHIYYFSTTIYNILLLIKYQITIVKISLFIKNNTNKISNLKIIFQVYFSNILRLHLN